MKIEYQKEFLSSILNMQQFMSGQSPSSQSFAFEAASTILGTGVDLDSLPFISESGVDTQELLNCIEGLNMEPIDFFDPIVQSLTEQGTINHMGQAINFGAAKTLFEHSKSEFIKHKESEDINHF